MLEHDGAQAFLIEPRHVDADVEAEGHGGEGEHAGEEGAGEAAEQIVELVDAGGADDRAVAGVVVAHDDVGDEGRARGRARRCSSPDAR